MIPVLMLFFALIALIILNCIQKAKGKFINKGFLAVITDHIANARIRTAMAEAANSPTYFGKLLTFALPTVDATDAQLGREKFEEAIADFMIEENAKVMVTINYLSLIAQIAPMVGLFGTVFGMVEAFATLSESGDADPTALSADISVALLTTLWGLVIAVPGVVAYFLLKGAVNSYAAESQKAALDAFDLMEETVFGEGRIAKIPEGLNG